MVVLLIRCLNETLAAANRNTRVLEYFNFEKGYML